MKQLSAIYRSFWNAREGFTLIELLVVIAIMSLLIGGAVAGYSRSNDRQLVFQSGHSFQSVLRLAQKKAMSGEKPAGCNTLRGYSVVGSGNTYTLNAVCLNNGVTSSIQDGSTYTLQPNVVFHTTLSPNVNFQYQALTGVVVQPSTPAMSNGSVDMYIGETSAGYFSLRVRESGSLFIICSKLMTSPPTCPP